MQLVDVPEMGYLTSDMPHPRGEIVATSGRLTPGYYNNPAANEAAFVTIGGKRHFRTGTVRAHGMGRGAVGIVHGPKASHL